MKRIAIIAGLLLASFYIHECVAEDLTDPKALLERGDSYRSAKDNEKALADYKKVIELAPGTMDAANAHYKCGGIYYETNNYDAAITEFNEVLLAVPDSANAFYMRGVSYIDSGRPETGIPDIDKVISTSPNSATAYNARATAYIQLGKFDSAIADLDNFIRLDPSDPSAYAKRATMYHDKARESGDVEVHQKAIADYTKCIEIKPDFRPDFVYRWRADSYAATGDQIAAIADYDRAIELAPNAAELYCDRGNANFRANRYKNAKEDYVKAVQLDPKGKAGTTARENLQVLVKTLQERSQSPAGLTQEESDKVTAMEQEWAMNIDKAVPFIRQRNYPAARVYVDKSRETVENIKKILAAKGYDVSKVDRLVGMEKLVDVYTNINRLGAYANEPQAAVKDIDKVRALFLETSARLEEAYAAFHEVPPLQELCRQIKDVLDGLEGEVNKYGR